MILFVAPNPFKLKEREGFLQRVAAIDGMFKGEKKVYFYDLADQKKQGEALMMADTIYVHSMYHANKIIDCYPKFAHKIITDLHGVVPEEEEYVDNMEMARVMADTEKRAFEHGINFVAVSEMMVRHFDNKYPSAKKRNWIVLPIYNDSGAKNVVIDEKKKDIQSIIYAGGGQGWQNVGLMVDAINKKHPVHTFTILTHDKDAFSGISEEAANDVVIKSVKSSEVAKYYEKASLGFILRNDTLVNRVACPTKLVEYLCYGVVPIVLSENIGDFKLLGYRYFTLRQLLEAHISAGKIREFAKENREIYEQFILQAAKGQKELVKMQHAIVRLKKAPRKDESEAVMLLLGFREKENTLLRYEYQIEAYKKMVTEYASMANEYRSKHDQHRSRFKKIDLLKNALRRIRQK